VLTRLDSLLLVRSSIGTDTAGSTRVPASFNGVVGLKPTLYSISTVGLVPACKTADCVTVLAPTVDDARQVYDVLRAYDPDDSLARPYAKLKAGLSPWRSEGIRFATPPSELLEVLSTPYAKLYKQAVDKLAQGGLAKADDFNYEPFEQANNMLYGSCVPFFFPSLEPLVLLKWGEADLVLPLCSSIVAQRLVAFDDYLTAHGTSTMHPVVASIFAASSGFSAVRAYQDLFLLAAYKRRVELEFEKADVLVVPSTVTHWKVVEVDEDPLGRNKILGSFTHFVNLVEYVPLLSLSRAPPAGLTTSFFSLRAQLVRHLGPGRNVDQPERQRAAVRPHAHCAGWPGRRADGARRALSEDVVGRQRVGIRAMQPSLRELRALCARARTRTERERA